jgi:hypothetical protein
MSNITVTHQTASDTAMIRGLDKRTPNIVFSLLGTDYTTQNLVDMLQKRVDAQQAAIDAHAAWIKAAEDARTLRADTAPVVAALKQNLLSRFAHDSGALADFDLHAPKKAQKPAKVKAEAADKAAATRKSNKTMGKTQKKLAKRAASEQPAPKATPTA